MTTAYPAPILRALPLCERPVERVAYVGTQAVSLHELLAAVIGGASQVEIAYELLRRFGDLPGLARASLADLRAIPGLGKAGAARIQAALELARRLAVAAAGEKPQIRSPADAAALLMPEMAHLEQEHLRVLYLDTRNHLVGAETVYIGNLSAVSIRAIEVFRGAVKHNCASILCAHNHPSGDPSPSPEDVAVTRALVEAGNLLDVEVVDHLIVSQERFVSLRERGLGFER
jgi:DNA repair protein RadC